VRTEAITEERTLSSSSCNAPFRANRSLQFPPAEGLKSDEQHRRMPRFGLTVFPPAWPRRRRRRGRKRLRDITRPLKSRAGEKFSVASD